MASATKWNPAVHAAIDNAAGIRGTSLLEAMGPALAKTKDELRTELGSPAQCTVNMAVFYLKSHFTLHESLRYDAARSKHCHEVLNSCKQVRR
jgi:hypothetical protein